MKFKQSEFFLANNLPVLYFFFLISYGIMGILKQLKFVKVNMPEEKNFAARVRLVREALGMNKNELAKELGISSTSLLNIEQGKHKPGHDFFEVISRKFNVNLYYLLHGKGSMFRNKKEEEFFWGIYEDSSLSEKDLDRLLYYLRGSPYVQYLIMGELNKIIDGNAAFVEKEVLNTKKCRDQ